MEARRVWMLEEKQRIIDEAAQPDANVSAIARKYDISTSQLFGWRKSSRCNTDIACSSSLRDSHSAQAGLLNEIEQFEKKISPLVIEKFLRDVRIGEVSAYNACNGYSALVGAFCKLASLKLLVLQNLPVKIQVEDDEHGLNTLEPTKKRELSRFAEILLVEMARRQIEKRSNQSPSAVELEN